MRIFTPPACTRFYAGVDLHARAIFVVVLDGDGQVRCARNLPANPEAFLHAVKPFRDGLLVACECMHCWYRLANTCRAHRIDFALGHAWAMKAVHGSKTKCGRKDAEASARLLKGGNFPPAYAYPKESRSLRDLFRSRLRLVCQHAPMGSATHDDIRERGPRVRIGCLRQPRQPDALMGRRPCPFEPAAPRGVGRGPERAQPKLSQENGFDAEASSQRSTRPPPRRRQ